MTQEEQQHNENVYLKAKLKETSNDLKAAQKLIEVYRTADEDGDCSHDILRTWDCMQCQIKLAEEEYEKAISKGQDQSTVPSIGERT